MSRQKTYYTADETVNNLFTKGKQWMTTGNVEYKGAYHRYLTGEIYTQSKWNAKISKKLIAYQAPTPNNPGVTEYQKLKPKIKTKFKSFSPQPVNITNENISIGYLTRYFVKKYDNNKIQEIVKKSYDEISNNISDKKLYTVIKLKWYISGQKQDTTQGVVLNRGVASKNLQQIKAANIKLPGINNVLTNTLQYYTDTDFIKPTDINGLDS
tara:strand:+ start:294 stop:926 length:633 start_codon:yes stop_codon:yes gene_type:complete